MIIDTSNLNKLTQTPWFKRWQQEWLDGRSKAFQMLSKPTVKEKLEK